MTFEQAMKKLQELQTYSRDDWLAVNLTHEFTMDVLRAIAHGDTDNARAIASAALAANGEPAV